MKNLFLVKKKKLGNELLIKRGTSTDGFDF